MNADPQGRVNRVATTTRAALDWLYRLSGALAGACLLALLAVIVAQMAARWTGLTFPGSTNYAGYLMAAASFLALGYAFGQRAHIRVNLLLSRLGPWRRLGEIWCLAAGSALAMYFAGFAIKANYLSWRLNDVSQGQDATPLWIPQLVMSAGTVILAVAFLDHLLRALRGRDEIWRTPPGGPPAT